MSIGSITCGDLVKHTYSDSLIGMVVEVRGDFPWRYRVVWNSGEIGEHETGVLRRVWCYGG